MNHGRGSAGAGFHMNQSKFSHDTIKPSNQKQSLVERRLGIGIVTHRDNNFFPCKRTTFERNKASAFARNKKSHAS